MAESYGFDPSFERAVASLAATQPRWYGKVRTHLDPDRMTDPTAALVVKAARAIAVDSGVGPDSAATVCQRIRRWIGDGKNTQEEFNAVLDLFMEQGASPPNPEQLLGELVPVIKRAMDERLVRATLDGYGRGDFSTTEDLIRARGRLGVIDEDDGKILGMDAFAAIAAAGKLERLPVGILEVDAAIGGGLPRGCLGMAIAPTSGGKCHAKGQGILMYDGSIKKVEHVVVGDRLVGPDGTPRNVLATNTGRDAMYDIVPSKGGDPWRVNIDHVLTLKLCAWSGSKRAGETLDVSVRDYLKWPADWKRSARLIRARAEFAPSAEILRIKPYLLGVILGDGSTANGTTSVCTPDKEIVEELTRAAVEYGLRIVVWNKKDEKAPTYGFSGTPGRTHDLARDLDYYGLRRVTGERKFVPQPYKSANVHTRREVLAGLLDTDGHYNGRGYDFISVSQQLARDVAFLARSLGLSAKVTPCRKGCQTGAVGDYWRVFIGGDIWIVPCRVQHKRAAVKARQRGNGLESAFKVTPSNTIEDYYGFSLDGDSRYLLDDFTVTHNSLFMLKQALQSLARGWLTGYVTLELSVEDTSARFIGALTGIPTNAIVGGGPAELEANRRLGLTLPHIGPLALKKMPAKATKVPDIIDWVKSVEDKQGRKMHGLVIDYADKVGSTNARDDSSYRAMDTVYDALREYMEHTGRFGWTASQAKRRDAKERQKRIESEDVADSISKARIIDLGISMTKLDGEITFYVAKNRHGMEDVSVGPLPTNFACGQLVSEPSLYDLLVADGVVVP